MPALTGFLWLIGYYLIGEGVIHLSGLPVSAGVVGMLALTATLIVLGRVPASLGAAAKPLIAMLAMLIMPGVVGVFFIFDELAGQWWIILAALILGTLASVATTLWLLKRLMENRHAR
ncbi:CidA/LrgA family protein [Halomonas sp. 707D7]|uniref:CidA/LrgA family protein n=1 Tax=Halomonas sp. 707D7 TaxID=1681044 RepID=UPI00209DED6D|nr:CidA/LrgA family protein [Halomonas sp. 707D7]MCP1314789.1 CidA/LrgA family protein [Halomonas sp. 707D7]